MYELFILTFPREPPNRFGGPLFFPVYKLLEQYPPSDFFPVRVFYRPSETTATD